MEYNFLRDRWETEGVIGETHIITPEEFRAAKKAAQFLEEVFADNRLIRLNKIQNGG